MIRLNKKSLLPLCALLLTSGGLLAVWWLGSDSSSGPADNRRDATVAPEAGSARVLKELSALRDAKNGSSRKFADSECGA